MRNKQILSSDRSLNGILLIDKPVEWTSHDIVNFIRKRFNIKKVGHGGTLDPIATGLLVVFLGQGTKIVKQFEQDDKEYMAVMGLGCETFSNDGTGTVLNKKDVSYIPLDRISDAFSRFLGRIEQKPPQVSAVKVKGQRLYKLAYTGKPVDPEPRSREIFSLEILHYHFPYIIFRMVCSKGTYVRKLCADIGELLGCGGYMSSLIRLRSGKFHLKDTLSIETLKQISKDGLCTHMVLQLPPVKPIPNPKRTNSRRFA